MTKYNLVGLKKEEFDELVKLKSPEGITLQPAKLIPFINPGKEEALTSIFLSSLKLIKEFREDILESIGIKIGKTGKIFVYTEVSFEDDKENRIDGLILVVKGGKISEAVLLELKNGLDELKEDQIKRYLEVAQKYGISKFVTISNQFVSSPTQFPLLIKPPKNIELYHLSWTYILTLAQILLFKNDKNIEDEDQVAIMQEVVDYFGHKKAGVCQFTRMKSGWKTMIERNTAGIELKETDADVKEAVESWMQEEKDMALILSRELGVLVKSGENKYKKNFEGRMNRDIKKLVSQKILVSKLIVERAVSEISIKVNFNRKSVEMMVSLNPHPAKKSIGQLGEIEKQIRKCQIKNENKFPTINNELYIGVHIKHSNHFDRDHINNIFKEKENFRNKEISEFQIIQIKDFGANFSKPNKFVETIEKMLENYYSVIVQNLEQPKIIAPKMVFKSKDDECEIDEVKEKDIVGYSNITPSNQLEDYHDNNNSK